jgi:hypothetical protein
MSPLRPSLCGAFFRDFVYGLRGIDVGMAIPGVEAVSHQCQLKAQRQNNGK